MKNYKMKMTTKEGVYIMEQLAYYGSTAYYTDELTRNIDKLRRISMLEYNWDGYGAEPFSTELILQAKNLLHEIHIQPEIFPTATGTIQLEYEKDNGDYLEFQFGGNSQCECFRTINGYEEYFSIPENSEAINELVEDFYG